jgi:hypothetical protein
MRTVLAIIVSFLLFNSIFGQIKSAKRGICGDASPEDLAAFASYVSWYYNWGVEPPGISQGQLSGIEWVPMQWGGISASQVAGIEAGIPDTSDYLLGFNEPNFTTQANLTPAQAAAMWPNIEKIADDKGLLIVSPAVNWCGECVDGVSSDPVDWLDKFIAECPTCKFDYIAIHNYNSYKSTLEWYVGKFKKYGKPIWLTEFASWDDPVDYAGVVQYMKEAIPYLESDTTIYRYSWFATRVGSNSNLDLLGANGELSKLGRLYATMPFEGSSTEDVGPIAFLPNETSINFPATSIEMSGNTYDPNGDTIAIQWKQVTGPGTAAFNNYTIANPTISNLVLGEYVFQMTATANGKSDSARITVNVNATNIAKGKTASASTTQSGNPASAAVDGNMNTRWSSLDSDPQWIKVDLGATYNLIGAKIVWEAAFAKKFSIDVSSDDENWNAVYNTITGTGGTSSYSFNATARYIRMYSTQRNNQSQWWGNSIYEFEVYGTLVPSSNNLTNESKISFYPNPFTNTVTIENLSSAGESHITIYDYSGRIILAEVFDANQSQIIIDVSDFDPGLYIVRLNNGESILSRSMVKE